MAGSQRSVTKAARSPHDTIGARHRGCSANAPVGDVQALLSRHHQDLDGLVSDLLATDPASPAWSIGLDEAWFGFAAHIDAEAAALSAVYRRTRSPELERVLSYIRAEHAKQQRLLHQLVKATDRGVATGDLLELRSALLSHDEQERLLLLPALRDTLPVAEYGRLATTYASERLLALGTMPIEVLRA